MKSPGAQRVFWKLVGGLMSLSGGLCMLEAYLKTLRPSWRPLIASQSAIDDPHNLFLSGFILIGIGMFMYILGQEDLEN